MIIRQFVLVSILLLTFFQLKAKPVTEPDALLLATNFHLNRFPTKLRSAVTLQLVYQGSVNKLRATTTEPAFYIYNIGDNQGFVLVSGDDAAKAILGYADEGCFKTENMPDNLRSWLNLYQLEIEAIRNADLSATANASEQISTVATGTTTVAPLLGGIKWNQTDPYNLLCPWDAKANTHTLAGCVAVAMTQIMNYHNWPIMGSGTHSYVDAQYGLQSVDFSKNTYDWSNILDFYGGPSNPDQDTAMATLVYQCGVAVDMIYSVTGSSSDINKAAEAFVGHFGYDRTIQRYERPYYTDAEWSNVIKNELDNARPVYYSGNSEEGGHAFVCDGYDSNNFFHINWGWGGSSNGYFELSSLSTAYPGVAGAAPEYTYLQNILTGIQKVGAINNPTNQVLVYTTGLSSSKSNVTNISTSSFDLSFSFANHGTNTVNTRWGIGFIKEGNTNIIKLVENSSTKYTTIQTGTICDNPLLKKFTISNPTGMLTAGTYRLYPIYMPRDSTGWSIMRGTPVLNNCMIVTVASNNGPATIRPALKTASLTLTNSPEPLSRLYLNKTVNVDLTIQNNGSEFYSRVGLCLISVTNPGNRTYICESKVLCSAGETKTIHLTGTVSCLPGNYYLQAQFDSTNSNSTMNYKVFGPTINNSNVVEVLPQPGTPLLQLFNSMILANGTQIAKNDTVNLTMSINNAGGYFDSRIIAFVFPKGGGRSLTYLTPKYVFIDSLETLDVTLTGTIDLDSGEYFFSIYQLLKNSWLSIAPYGMYNLNFTVTNGTVDLIGKNETRPLYIHQVGDELLIETKSEIRESHLFDMSGRLVRKVSDEKAIQIGDLAKGVYLLHVQTNGRRLIERFLKH